MTDKQSVLSVTEKMEAELKLRRSLVTIEKRRAKSIETVTKTKHIMYDKQRAKLLATLPADFVQKLRDEGDPFHAEYLARQAVPEEVSDADVEEMSEENIETVEE